MPRITRKAIEAHIRAERGVDVELVRGDGYFYFVGDMTFRWRSQSVATMHLGALTLDQWLGEYDALAKDSN